VATSRPKRFEYAVEVDDDGTMRADGTAATSPEEAWSPDHLLLAALVRCVLTSLEYHARRSGIESRGAGSAHGTVTKRESDERFAFVEIEADLRAWLSPRPDEAELQELLAKAERDCFVGASLTVVPTYRWSVNAEATGSA
jgi:organic hydroperoxide reductase OsmC/OhrA